MQALKFSEHCQRLLGASLPESAIFREEGVSGRTGSLKKRPGLSAALDACLAGTYTHLVVHKLDRLGRNVGLAAYVREVHAAWHDADPANRRLLVRTLFEQLWVVGDRIVAVKPVAQFAPFFRLLRRRDEQSGQDALGEPMYLAPESVWNADAEAVGALAKEMTRDAIACHGSSVEVQTGGPDEIRTRGLRRDRPAC